MPTQENDKKYYQFPLCCLSFGGDYKTRLYHIVSFCIVSAGAQKRESMDRDELTKYATDYDSEKCPSGMKKTVLQHLEILAGMKFLGVTHGNVEETQNRAAAIASHIRNTTEKEGAHPLVRIRNDLFWDCIKGNLPYRDFAVLTAVYAAIGSKTFPVRVTRDRIQAGALGYKTKASMTPEALAQRIDGATPLTENQIRYTLDHLEATTLFSRVQLSPRKVYFSNRMTAEQMRKQLVSWKTRPAVKLASNRKADREMQQAIKSNIKAVEVL